MTDNLIDLATRLGVDLPQAVTEARAKHAEIRRMSRGTKPVPAYAAEIIAAADPAKALAKAAVALAADREIATLAKAAEEHAAAAVEAAVREAAHEIADAVIGSRPVAEAVAVIAETAPVLPADVSPTVSVDDADEATLVAVARVRRAWATVAGAVEALRPGASAEDVALIVFDVSEADANAFRAAARGFKTGGDWLAAGVARTGDAEPVVRVLPAVAIAHLSGVAIAPVASLDEYRVRRAAFSVPSTSPVEASAPKVGVFL